MASFQKPGHGSRYVGSGAPSTSREGNFTSPDEGKITQHPKTGEYFLHQKGFHPQTFGKGDEAKSKAEAELALRQKHGWKTAKQRYNGMMKLKSFNEFVEGKE